MTFIWLDDNPDRQKDATILSRAIGTEIKFISLKNQDIDDILFQEAKINNPDLIILDHSLDQGHSKTIRTGSTAAAYFHEIWPQVPIVSVTGVDIPKLDSRHKDAYEDIFSITNISSHKERILAIASGVRHIKNNLPSTIEKVVQFFEAPESEHDKFVQILPNDLKSNFENPSYPLEVYRWANEVLFDRPGFLYNDAWTSAFLGIKQEFWAKYENIFEDAKYTGVFADVSNPLWWKGTIIDILNGMFDDILPPWILGTKLLEDEKEATVCYFSGEPHPEIIAAVDDSENSDWYPMKIKHTESHPGYDNILYFDDLRVMK